MDNFFYNLNDKLNNIRKQPETAPDQLNEAATGDYSAKAARAGQDIGKPGKQFAAIAKSAGERYGSKKRGERVAGAVLKKLRMKEEENLDEKWDAETKVSPAEKGKYAGKGIAELQKAYNKLKASGPHKKGSPDFGRMRELAFAIRAKKGWKGGVNEADVEEGNEFTAARLAAIKSGKPTFKVGDKVYRVTGDTSDEHKQVDEGQPRIGGKDMTRDLVRAIERQSGGQVSAKRDAEGVLQLIRKKAQEKKAKLMAEIKLADLPVRQVKGRAYGAEPQEFDQDDADDVEIDQAPKKRGRPKGTGRKIGAKGPTGRSKLLTRENMPPGATPDDAGEYGNEGDMAKDQIHTIVRNARQMERVLSNQEDLPEWVQAKLAKIEGMMTAVSEYMQTQHERGHEEAIAEKAVSKAQQRFMGMVHAAQKGEKPASKAVAKVAREMPKKAAKDYAKTKHAGLPNKIKQDESKKEVEETTVSGSVATAPAVTAPKGKKGGMQFGKGIYDSVDREVESLITESMNVSVNMSTDEHGESQKNLTVTANGDDADQLAQILRLSGMKSHDQATCDVCGTSPCGCEQELDENHPDWPTDTVTSDDALQYSGGLNKPKTDVAGAGQTTVPVTAVRVAETDTQANEQGRILELAGLREARPDFPDIDHDGDRSEPISRAAADLERMKESDTGDAPIDKMSDEELANYIGASVEAVRQDRAHAEELARERSDDLKESNQYQTTLVNMNRLWKQYKA